jgi:hypothetical protein
MASDPKAPPPASSAPSPRHRGEGIRIFTYPKVIFIFPTMVTALICGIAMKLSGDQTADPLKAQAAAKAAASAGASGPEAAGTQQQVMLKHERFMKTQNLLGVLFLGVLAFNLLIMALDFPRFTVVAIFLLIMLALFVLLWIGAYFDYDLMEPARKFFGGIYTVANAGFYFMFASIVAVIFAIVYLTRFLDYWEILPNEILHHHGPLSDLERYPTLNLKFDKEIPDVFEFLFLGAGKLVLHVTEERKAIVLDNVLFINAKEAGLKRLMSRLEVRVTTDQEASQL